MDKDLLEKIKVCVAYDLIGRGKLRTFEDMSIVEKNRFIKQVNRLYDACMILTKEQSDSSVVWGGTHYINERYDDIMQFL